MRASAVRLVVSASEMVPAVGGGLRGGWEAERSEGVGDLGAPSLAWALALTIVVVVDRGVECEASDEGGSAIDD